MRCKWFYTWTSKIPDGVTKETPFVPMISKYRGTPESVINPGKAAKREGIRELLGFNEPDQSKQANMTVEEALAAWPLLQETGLRLGSPAGTDNSALATSALFDADGKLTRLGECYRDG